MIIWATLIGQSSIELFVWHKSIQLSAQSLRWFLYNCCKLLLRSIYCITVLCSTQLLIQCQHCLMLCFWLGLKELVLCKSNVLKLLSLECVLLDTFFFLLEESFTLLQFPHFQTMNDESKLNQSERSKINFVKNLWNRDVCFVLCNYYFQRSSLISPNQHWCYFWCGSLPNI